MSKPVHEPRAIVPGVCALCIRITPVTVWERKPRRPGSPPFAQVVGKRLTAILRPIGGNRWSIEEDSLSRRSPYGYGRGG